MIRKPNMLFRILVLFGLVSSLVLVTLLCLTCNSLQPPSTLILQPTLYDSPIWHPSGKFIAFNHTPFKRVHYASGGTPDRYDVDIDSSGFWLINPDGKNMHRVLPYMLQTPAWSLDGQWVAFVSGQQIFKMQFTGTVFDTTTVEQLGFPELRSFFPSWSPDGQLIAYDVSLPEGYAGIWTMRTDGSQNHRIFGGAYPAWNPNGQSILAVIGTSPTSISTRFIIFQLDSSRANDTLSVIMGNDNRSPKYSPDGSTIAFASQPMNKQFNLWMMDSIGSNLRQLTFEGMSDGSGTPFSWDPTGRFIVFTQYRFDQWLPQNGTLWILDLSTGQKGQLTFNLPESP